MAFPLWVPFENEWATFFILLASIFLFILASNFIINKNLLSPDKIRRIIHLSVGTLIVGTPFIFTNNTLPNLLAIIFIILNITTYKTNLFKGIHSQNRVTYGTIYFPISFVILTTFFWDFPELIIISLSILAFADPLAAEIGESFKNPIEFIVWNDKKTIQGTFTFFITSFIIIYISGKLFFDYSNLYFFLFTMIIAAGATIAEVTSSKGSDNLSIPLVSIILMICFFELIPPSNHSIIDMIIIEKIFSLILIIGILFLSYKIDSLNINGLFGGIIMGIIIFTLGSYSYVIPIAVFFILSSLLGKVLNHASFYKQKESGRNIIQVYSNGGIGLLICIYNYFHPDPINFLLFLSSTSAAMSDTWGTEFGKLSKNKPISIITFKKINHGLSGGITKIGTLGSLLGSCFIGAVGWFLNFQSPFLIYGIIFSGFSAALFDSILGGSIQAKYENNIGEVIEKDDIGNKIISGKAWMTNDLVNLINTATAPIIMYLIILISK